jgi:lipopolysaccharide transport system ATP-binding protein
MGVALHREQVRQTDPDGYDTVVSVRNVAKKFCKKLRRSMSYGIQDLAKNLVGIRPDSATLRMDEFWALRDITFELHKGDVLGLIGVNGSGKTTLLRLLTGIFPPDKGEIMIRGRVGALIALGTGFHPYFSGRENIYLNGAILGLGRDELDAQFDEIVQFSEIGDFIDAPVATYSSGMRVRLGFAVAMAMKPDLLLIDEVLAVGDLGFKVKCLNKINELMEQAAVIFVSHSMQYVYRICNQVMVLHKGEIVHHGNDVQEGIDYYHSQFNLAEKRVSGSGKATLSDIHLYHAGHKAASDQMLLINCGDDLVIDMTLRIQDAVREPVIRVFIYNQAMQPVADCWSEQNGWRVGTQAMERKIRLTLKNLQFHSGVYSIGVVVLDLPDHEILYRSDYLAFFQVKNIAVSWAPVMLSGEWEHLNGE